MLDELHVQNIALISDATFTPGPGLTVVTGETGAGKTALLSALKLLTGERADTSMVRDGQESAQVEGRFFLASEPDNADGHVVERQLSAQGRSRVRIDGAMASIGRLAEEFGTSVDLCGQHEHQRLLQASHHMALLDAWAGDSVAKALSAYQVAFDQVTAARKNLEQVTAAGNASSAQLEEARFTLRRIEEVNPRVGEYEEILEQLPRVENAEDLANATDEAYWNLMGDDGALSQVNEAANALEGMAHADAKLGEMAQALREASFILEAAAREARNYRDGLDRDPQLLYDLQERAGALQGLMRAFGPRMEDVFAKRDAAQALIEAVDDSAARIKRAQKELDAAESALQAAAKELHKARSNAAPKFSKQVCAQMARLEMGGAELLCQVDMLPREQWKRTGPSSAEFMYRASQAMTPRPLARIASGGEASRVMLACKVVMGASDDRETLVFDEVDAGVGGSVAVALAAVLADLAKTHQVIVVTHLAQVAVRATCHYVVRKAAAGEDGIPETLLAQVEGDARVFEVARMLSGDTNAESLAHARALLEASEA